MDQRCEAGKLSHFVAQLRRTAGHAAHPESRDGPEDAADSRAGQPRHRQKPARAQQCFVARSVRAVLRALSQLVEAGVSVRGAHFAGHAWAVQLTQDFRCPWLLPYESLVCHRRPVPGCAGRPCDGQQCANVPDNGLHSEMPTAHCLRRARACFIFFAQNVWVPLSPRCYECSEFLAGRLGPPWMVKLQRVQYFTQACSV